MGIVSQGSSDHVCPLGPLTLLGARFPLYAGERDDVGWVTGWGLIVEGPGWDLYGPGGCGGLVEVTGEEVTLGRGYNAGSGVANVCGRMMAMLIGKQCEVVMWSWVKGGDVVMGGRG
jgi:hypothetical protein